MAPAGSTDEALQMLQQFQQLQQQRAQLYSSLHGSFKEFMSTGQEGAYRRTMAELMPAFNSCSQQIISIEAALKEQQGRRDLADLLRAVQEGEREKLRLTLSLHALRQALSEGIFAWQHPPDPSADADAVGNEPERPRHQHQHGCSEQSCGNPAQRVTRVEFDAALGEAQLQLDAVVQGINALLDEVRHAVLELQEQRLA